MRNRAAKSRIKNLVKNVRIAVENQSAEHAQAALQEAIPAIDRAASKGILHHRTASRKISRLSKKVHALSAQQE